MLLRVAEGFPESSIMQAQDRRSQAGFSPDSTCHVCVISATILTHPFPPLQGHLVKEDP